MTQPIERVVATKAALRLIARLQEQHGPVMFHQPGRCCDGSAPMCYPQGEFQVGGQDVLLGHIGGCPFYIGRAQSEYWQYTQLIIDVVLACGAIFSLEGSEGFRFLTRSRLFTDEEWAHLRPLEIGA